jgi:hypothetical protein
MPSRASLSQSERDLYSRIRKLLNEPGVLRGNLVEMMRRCGKKNCRCNNNPEFRHRALCLGLSVNGKHRTIYIPAEWEERVREWTTRHSQIGELLENLSLKSLERLEKRKE